jgi:hypothetical protein
MTREYRGFLRPGLLAGASAATLALVVAWGAPPSEKTARAQTEPPAPVAPRSANEATKTNAPPLVKPSETPHLLLLFTDQVVGYIQPCG